MPVIFSWPTPWASSMLSTIELRWPWVAHRAIRWRGSTLLCQRHGRPFCERMVEAPPVAWDSPSGTRKFSSFLGGNRPFSRCSAPGPDGRCSERLQVVGRVGRYGPPRLSCLQGRRGQQVVRVPGTRLRPAVDPAFAWSTGDDALCQRGELICLFLRWKGHHPTSHAPSVRA